MAWVSVECQPVSCFPFSVVPPSPPDPLALALVVCPYVCELQGAFAGGTGTVVILPGEDIPAATIALDAIPGMEEFLSFDDISPCPPVRPGVQCVVTNGPHKASCCLLHCCG